MRVTVGSVLLGDLESDVPIGGFTASGGGETQKGKGSCSGLSRLRLRGGGTASFSVPTKLTFPSVAEAQKWICDTAKVGGYEGLLRFAFEDGSQTLFPWAVARPDSLSHRGVLVTAQWRIEAGEKLE
ncbi:MAG TPA: hypothetical protein PLA50_00300 [Bacteroidia bacterium]|nr:hypothetical protein [Bacteroidia bacterium]